jgi:hypothetical protein
MRVGKSIRCTVCGRRKKPHGRSAPMGYPVCDDECSGYDLEPKVGCLWPGESEKDFGYPCCAEGTEEQEEEEVVDWRKDSERRADKEYADIISSQESNRDDF